MCVFSNITLEKDKVEEERGRSGGRVEVGGEEEGEEKGEREAPSGVTS